MRKDKKSKDALCIDEKYMERKEKLTSFFSYKKYVKMTKKEIANILNISKEDMPKFELMLKELERKGKIFLDRNKRYNIARSYRCIFDNKSSKFGFARVIDEEMEDFYISNYNFNTAMDGDEVLVVEDRYSDLGHRKQGKIIEIVNRNTKKIIGTLYNEIRNYSFVVPINENLPSIKVKNTNYNNNSMVEVLITKYPDTKNNSLEGEIINVISETITTKSYVDALYISNDLNELETFNDSVKEEIKNINSEVNKEDLKNREDRTNDNVYTIDSEEAKDLDDAISVVKNNDGSYKLSVYIADVSNYVKDGTFLDLEASARGTSIYVPGSVLPMLPKELSNGICSLNENEIRLVLGVDMLIDKKGNVKTSRVFKGYIKSKKKMTYEKVYKCILKSDSSVLEEYKEYLDDINNMLELSTILREKRFKEGSINFDIPETKVILDEKGNVKDITTYETNISNYIIEEFMLITNEVIAKKFINLNAPFIYRVHEKPDEEKLRDFNEVLNVYGKKLRSVKDVTPKMINEILENFRSEEEKRAVSTIALRTLKLAKYSNECLGHFGLSFKYYCHFTSPIRRYPDLFIHRVISDYLENNYVISSKKYNKYLKQAISYSDISSEREKNATKIERDFDDLYMCIFMSDKIGQVFEGRVSSVTSFGMFVKLENTVEGLVHVKDLKGYYVYDEKHFTLSNGNKVYKIGDKLKVKLVRSDVRIRQIDFEVEE